MKNKFITALKVVIPIIFWLAVWEASAIILDFSYFLPDIIATLKALVEILSSMATYEILFQTFSRVIASIVISAIFAVILAIISYKYEAVRIMISPLLAVMKSVPVAIFSVLFYVFIRGDIIPLIIASFMIMPMIWQNVLDGYDSIDKSLYEVCQSYEFSFKKRFKILIFPALIKYFIPAVITSVGFAWKAVISSEILVRTVDSVGLMISDSKYQMDTAASFAWTFLAIILSIALEKIIKKLLGRCRV